MKLFLPLLCAVSGLLALSNGQDLSVSFPTEENATQVFVKVLGQSGKIMVSSQEDVAADPDRVVIEMDSLTERDIDGIAVGTSGSVKHSFNTFASQDFTFSDIFDANLGNATAKALNFSSTLLDQAELTVTVFLITEEGSLDVGTNETFELKKGEMKFNVAIENWPFCAAGGSGNTLCTQGGNEEVGHTLDFDIIIKANGNASKVDGGVDKYSLGGDVAVDLSRTVLIDDQASEMAEGFPKLEVQGSKQIFTFRFPIFNVSAVYDPVVSGIVAESDGGDPTEEPLEEEVSLSHQGVTVDVKGSSGKFIVSTLSDTEDSNAITVELDSLTERSSDGTAVGSTGTPKHSFNSFASQDFVFSELYETTVGNGTASALNFTATLVGNSTLQVTTFIMEQDALLELDTNETFFLKAGMVKFNVNIDNWPFCTACGSKQDEVGEFLDLDISIKGKNSATPKDGGVSVFDLGGDVTIDLSKSIQIDGSRWISMAEEYPKLTTSNNKETFTFRFPKFESSAVYDPIIDMGVASDMSAGNYKVASITLTCFIAALTLFI